MGKKTIEKKQKLIKAARSARPVPAFVRLKTKRKVTFSPARRHWRRRKLKIR